MNYTKKKKGIQYYRINFGGYDVINATPADTDKWESLVSGLRVLGGIGQKLTLNWLLCNPTPPCRGVGRALLFPPTQITPFVPELSGKLVVKSFDRLKTILRSVEGNLALSSLMRDALLHKDLRNNRELVFVQIS